MVDILSRPQCVELLVSFQCRGIMLNENEYMHFFKNNSQMNFFFSNPGPICPLEFGLCERTVHQQAQPGYLWEWYRILLLLSCPALE